MNNENEIEIYVVDVKSDGVAIAFVVAVEKDKVYVTKGKSENLFGWQWIGKRVRKDDNVFTSAREATQYACQELAEKIDTRQEELNTMRNDLQALLDILKQTENPEQNQ